MSTRNAFVAIAVASCILMGCGEESSQSFDPSQRLEGRELRRASDLEGTWLALSQGTFLGIEFMADGRALATPVTAAYGGAQSILYDYSVIDGGRLALVEANGRGQQVFTIKINGGQIEMQGFADTQRLMRLPKGQTLQQGVEEQSKIREAEWEKRYQVVNAFLGNPDLVIEPSTPVAGAPPSMALELNNSGGGRAWYDDTAPHLDAVSLQIDSVEGSNVPIVQISFGQQIQPPTAERNRGGSITFTASGDMLNPTFLSTVTYSNRNLELVLRRDSARHHEIVGRFDSEMARVAALYKPITDLLKDVAVLDGELSTNQPMNPNGYREHVVLTRDPATGLYAGSSVQTLVDRPGQVEFPRVSAEVQLVDDQPLLIISTPVRQFQLRAAAGKLTGGWFPTGFAEGYAADFTITRATDAATVQRENDAQKQALLSLRDAMSFLGFVNQFPAVDRGQVSMIVLTVSPQRLDFADFVVNGTSAVGTIAGQLRAQSWMLEMKDTTPGKRTLAGTGSNVVGPIEFTEITDAWRADQRRTITQALTAGANFALTIPPDEGSVLKFKLEPTTNAVVGEVVSGGPMMAGYVGLIYQGELTEVDGFPALTVTARTSPDARYPVDQQLMWVGVQKPEGILLTGYSIDNRRNGWRYQNEMLAGSG